MRLPLHYIERTPLHYIERTPRCGEPLRRTSTSCSSKSSRAVRGSGRHGHASDAVEETGEGHTAVSGPSETSPKSDLLEGRITSRAGKDTARSAHSCGETRDIPCICLQEPEAAGGSSLPWFGGAESECKRLTELDFSSSSASRAARDPPINPLTAGLSLGIACAATKVGKTTP